MAGRPSTAVPANADCAGEDGLAFKGGVEEMFNLIESPGELLAEFLELFSSHAGLFYMITSPDQARNPRPG